MLLQLFMKTKENKSLFLQHFGDTPQLRTMDFFIDNFMFDYPLTQIAREANVSYNSLKIFINLWIKSNVIIKTRKIGKSEYFQLNTNHPFVKDLMKLDWNLATRAILTEKEIEAR